MASNSMQTPAMIQVIPNELWVSLESNDSTMMKAVRASHAPDGRKVDVKPMLRIIDNILLRAAPAIVEGTYEDKGLLDEEISSRSDVDAKLKTLASIIKKVSSELFSHNNLILSGTFKANSNVNQTIIPYGVDILNQCNFRSEETTELLDLSRLASEGSKILVILKSYKTIYKEYEDEKCKTAYWDLVKTFSSTHSDNMTVLKTLVVAKDGKQHLVGHASKVCS
uniref:Sieve element occlusion N-terminal domain-containing protein n=1 Tax=Populus alba TaxID=43335 RepID=A0A4U5MHQ5_POPAL|nr:hypothetical protein D5086_0000308500 [Populus alba]